jgi:pimeloyl-ACP methyl ester carboxylesterase
MSRVTSKDGTSIGYDRMGAGPAVILVGGGLDDGSENAPLAVELASSFTVVNYSRRGRGGSGDTPPYAVERELEDLAALIAEAGGSAHLFGVSSGGALALEAAAAGLAIDRVAGYEVPYCVAGEMVHRSREFVERLAAIDAAARPGDALALFLWLAGSSEEDIAAARSSPMWAPSEALAHTLAYDAACMSDYRLPADRFPRISQPTLIITGGPRADPYTPAFPPDFFDQAAAALVSTIPNARRQTLEGQGHVADPKAVAPVLMDFFTE